MSQFVPEYILHARFKHGKVFNRNGIMDDYVVCAVIGEICVQYVGGRTQGYGHPELRLRTMVGTDFRIDCIGRFIKLQCRFSGPGGIDYVEPDRGNHAYVFFAPHQTGSRKKT